jgi:hypothetical protein
MLLLAIALGYGELPARPTPSAIDLRLLAAQFATQRVEFDDVVGSDVCHIALRALYTLRMGAW